MKKLVFLFLIAALPLAPQESSVPEREEPRGNVAGFASRDAHRPFDGWMGTLASRRRRSPGRTDR